ncbi:alpha/beta fold hydrolase [Agrobacterium radiobacter]|jgi:pimeloyl-ACP methyl ester carboxylesterase|uniref:alpha/beta fold hydrolase n=1 Tax=Agrobacterium radiobacter TaxID=362 RepID=UPI000DCF746D|nr:alpha/beta hydrolase [Agrobacterium radiobacter]MBB4409029.1 pimeloyl-ACP methyl ester carboxylesterase [Agrobacterium radiobacter]MBB4453909.1 pimeloyl-ACP methyl ester carboxylesterase [Agrobacterium radiobacter]
MRTVKTDTLEIAYFEHGSPDGWPVVLSHGFPYDVHAYDEVAPRLAEVGARVIVPYLRGFGPTRFRSSSTMRSGQQAALGKDVIDLLDALDIEKAVLAGYDWGGLASCVASALWPDRVAGLVSYAGYDVIDVNRLGHAYQPSLEQAVWYQHLFQHERGRECLALHRRDLCRILWKQWSPTWAFDDATFDRTAASFDNPDFVDVVIHSYRFDFGNAAGDPALADLETRLAEKPPITVPAITIDGTQDPLKPGGTADHAPMFKARHEHRVAGCGHNLPWEAPHDFADAITTVQGWCSFAS